MNVTPEAGSGFQSCSGFYKSVMASIIYGALFDTHIPILYLLLFIYLVEFIGHFAVIMCHICVYLLIVCAHMFCVQRVYDV